MEIADVIAVLRVAAEYDNRIVTGDMATAWYQVIRNYVVEDAIAAVVRHYSESTDRIMPAHVRKLIPAARDERQRLEQRTAPRQLPSKFDDNPEQLARNQAGRAAVEAVIAGVVRKLAVPNDDLDTSGVAPQVQARHAPHAVRTIAEAQANVRKRRHDNEDHRRWQEEANGDAAIEA